MSTLVTDSSKPAAASTSDHPQSEAANRMYPDASPPQKELFPVDVALEPLRAARDPEVAAATGKTTDERASSFKDITEAIRQSGLDAYTFGQPFYTAVIEANIAEARGTDDPDELALRIQQDNENVRRELAELFGQKESEDLLSRAAAFVRKQSKLAALMQRRGIGSRPEIVRAVVEHVRRINFR